MSEVIASGIIEKSRLVDFAETLATSPTGVKTELVSEAKIHFDSDGFHVAAVDSANVCMVTIDLHARAFDHYEAPGASVMGVNLTKLIDRLKPAANDALVEFEIDMETRHLRLSYGNASVSIALIDPDSIRKEPDMGDIDLPNEVVLDGGQFDHGIEVVDMVSEHLEMHGDVDEREFTMRGEGDIDDAVVAYDDGDLIDASVDETVESIYSIDYLKHLAYPMPDDSEVTIRFGDEYPVRVNWSAFDGGMDVQQNLAPRIQSR